MRNRIELVISLLGLTITCLPACIGAADPLEGESDSAAQELFTKNALRANALTADRLAVATLVGNPLTSASVARRPEVMSALRDPLAREFLTYTVGCALPAGESVEVDIDGEPHVFEGDIGLSPEWGRAHGQCNTRCQGWLSACMLARVNHLGESVPISMRGRNKALDAGPAERAAFPHREGAYFGDLFAAEPLRLACTSPGSTLISRVCGGAGAETQDCIVDVVGECDDVCGVPESDGSFPNCSANDRPNTTTVTIFRQ